MQLTEPLHSLPRQQEPDLSGAAFSGDEQMYIPPWPGLTLRDLIPAGSPARLPYPFTAEHHWEFCVARSGIYHLFRALRFKPGDTVLVPDYHSGNEVAAIRAAGANITFYPVLRNLEPDIETLSRLAARGPRAIYVIHYLGWPQPMQEIQNLCRQSGAILIEDCALSLLSQSDGTWLGSFGDYSIFCLYKTLPVPNGGMLVRNNDNLPGPQAVCEPCPALTSAGRTAELALEAFRSRWSRAGKAVATIKQSAGRALRAADVRTVPVGDIGWNINNVNVGMSSLSRLVLRAVNAGEIRRRRRENFQLLRQRLHGKITMLREDLNPGVCPLFFPVLVRDKHAVAQSLRQRGIQAVEFWNDKQDYLIGPEARYLRTHVLEIPIHQGVTHKQLEYIAREVRSLNPEPAPRRMP